MKKIVSKIKFYFPLLVLIAFLSSCDKENFDPSAEKQEKTDGFEVVNGFLAFDSDSSFIATIDAIANINDEDRNLWESKIGFISQRSIVNNIIKQEIIHDRNLETRFRSGKISEIGESDIHSDAYFEALDKGVIKIIDEGTSNEYWDYAAFNRGFIDFVNEDGLFAIGDTLYQVTASCLKMMKPADINNPQVLIESKEQDLENNIFFINKESALKSTSPGLIESNWIELGTGKKGDKRIKIGIFLDVKYYSPSNWQYFFYHDVYVQCQERNWLRNWIYKFTTIDVDGEWDIYLYYYPEHYGSTWSWNGSASYLKASINPSNGSTAPYQSYFSVTPNNPLNIDLPWFYGDQADYPPQYDSYNWSAVRSDAGLEATLVK